MGKRLGEYTRNNTKCMVEVNGTRLIDRMIRQLVPLGLDRLVMVVGYHGRELMEYLGNERYGLRIEYVENPVYDRTTISTRLRWPRNGFAPTTLFYSRAT